MTYSFLGQVRIEGDVTRGDVHVPLEENVLEEPAGIFFIFFSKKRATGFGSQPRFFDIDSIEAIF